jgi:hypothetical protein
MFNSSRDVKWRAGIIQVIETKQTNSDVAHKPSYILTTAVLPPGSAMVTQIVISFP